MRIFLTYTLARIVLFLAVYGLLWLVVGRSLDFDAVSGLYTALIAMIISALLSLVLLRGLRERLAVQVAERAAKAKAAFDARVAAEDRDS